MARATDLERAVFGGYATHAVHLAMRHGVFAHLARGGPAPAADIAAATGADPRTLERLLLVLDTLGVLDLGPGGYAIPVDSLPYLDDRDPRYLGGFVHHLVTSTAAKLPRLDDYLAKGKEVVDAGLPSPFEAIYADERSVREFLTAMWDLSFHVSGELAALAGLAETGHLVDVGGASGAFAVAALRSMPDLRVTVFDLPPVGPHLAATAEEHGLGGRLAFEPGDFFRDELPAADCLSFGYILSDWTDETCGELLAKAHRACAPGGRVLVMERLFDDDGRGPLATAVMNLSMHVETQGRHRTAAEYADLLARAGFTDVVVRRSTADKHLVIGRKPGGGLPDVP